MAVLADQVSKRSDEMDRAIVTRRTHGLPFAKSVVAVAERNRTMDMIHAIAGQIREEGTRMLQATGRTRKPGRLPPGFTVAFFLSPPRSSGYAPLS